MGVAEILIVLAVLVVLLLVFGGRRTRPAPTPVAVALPAELQARVRDLYGRDQRIRAIKELREATSLSLRDAKRTADALAAGRTYPVPRPPLDLATRARALLDAGRHTDAVTLVTTETGLTPTQAESFLRSLP